MSLFKSLSGLRELRFILCQHCKSSTGARYLPPHADSSSSATTSPSPSRPSKSSCANARWSSPTSTPPTVRPPNPAYGISKKVSLESKTSAEIATIIEELQKTDNKAAHTVAY